MHSSPHPLSIALIGASGYARQVLNSLQAILEPDSAKLAGITVINPDQEREACRRLTAEGCSIHADHRQMLDSLSGRLDLCIIPTSIHLHSSMTLDALRAGAHVLVEKPLAGSSEEARAMIAAGEASGKGVSVGFQDMYAPQVWEIQRRLLSGAIGKIGLIRVTGSWPRDQRYYTRNGWAGRFRCEGRPVYDSPLNNGFAHFLNLALFFAGAAAGQVAAVDHVSGRLLRFFPIETLDTAQVRLRTDTGAVIECLLTHASSERRDPLIEIEAERGSLVWRQEQDAVLADLHGREIERWTLNDEEANRRRMLRRVIETVRSGLPPICPASLALSHVEAIEKIHRTLRIEEGAEASSSGRNSPWDPIPGLFSRLTGQAPDRSREPEGEEAVVER